MKITRFLKLANFTTPCSNAKLVIAINLWLKLDLIKNSQIKKIHYMVIRFFCKIHSNRKRKTSKGDFSIGYGTQLA
jgi:hypothetical protein